MGQGALEFIVILGTDILFFSLGYNAVGKLLGNLEVLLVVFEGGILLLQCLALVVHIAEVGIDDEALRGHFPMEFGIAHGVQGHELVGHDAAAAVNQTVPLEGIVSQRVGKVNAVGIGQLAALQALQHVLGIVFLVALFVGLLDAAARRRVVVGDGEAHHRTVRQIQRTLHQSFAIGSATDDGASVVVLDGTRNNLGSRCRIAIYQHVDLAFGE